MEKVLRTSVAGRVPECKENQEPGPAGGIRREETLTPWQLLLPRSPCGTEVPHLQRGHAVVSTVSGCWGGELMSRGKLWKVSLMGVTRRVS